MTGSGSRGERIAALKVLYDAGAFLFPANDRKAPIRSLEGSKYIYNADGIIIGGEPVAKLRAPWPEIEAHASAGGHVLYYEPGKQGILVLDFDPMVELWIERVSDRLGAEPLERWQSSGKLKPATLHKPAGYGGHVAWRIPKDDKTKQRDFSYEDDGPPVGQVFAGDGGFGFIVYDAVKLVDVMQADDIECVDASKLPKAKRPKLLDDNGRPIDPDSRHGSAMSALASAAFRARTLDEYHSLALTIETDFLVAIAGERDVRGEWERMYEKGKALWHSDHPESNPGFEYRAPNPMIANLVGPERRKANAPDPAPTHAPKRVEVEEDRWMEIIERIYIRELAEAAIRVMHKREHPQEAIDTVVEACKEVGRKFEIPESHALIDVRLLIDVLMLVKGVDRSLGDAIESDYITTWSKAGRVKMRHGDFPMVEQFVRATGESKGSIVKEVQRAGGVVLQEKKNDGADDWMTMIRATGAELVWSYLDAGFVIKHPDVDEWKDWKLAQAPDYEALLQLQKGVARSVFYVEEKKVSRDRGDGNKEESVIYTLKKQVRQEVDGKVMARRLHSNVGSQIKRVDYSQDMTNKYMAKMRRLSKFERDNCVYLASNWIMCIPGVEILPEHRAVAEAMCKIFYAMFAHRRLQSFDEYKKRGIRQQRHVPILAGLPKVGKSTIIENLLPPTQFVQERSDHSFKFSSDINDMLRQMRGKFLVNADELNGLKHSNAEAAKQIITLKSGNAHAKFENYKYMERTDVLVGTTNKAKFPGDEALHDRLLPLTISRDTSIPMGEYIRGIKEWFAANHEKLLIGGLIMAIEEHDIEPPEEIDSDRAKMLDDLSARNHNFGETIEMMARNDIHSHVKRNGEKRVSIRLVCLYAGLLQYTEDVKVVGSYGHDRALHRKGDTILPEHGTGEDDTAYEFGKYTRAAFTALRNNSSRSGAITQIKSEVARLTHNKPTEQCRKNNNPERFECFGVWGTLAEIWGLQDVNED